MGFSVAGLRKAYDGVPVLKGVDLTVEDGEIHALLGANGAGKSTLIKCLAGAIQADEGDLRIDGATVDFARPSDAQSAGVQVVHQIPTVALSLNAQENVFLGRELRTGPFMRRGRMRKLAQQWFDEFDLGISAQELANNLSNAELQMVEIVKALGADPRFLILDEPTAALTSSEQRELIKQLHELRSRNLPILYVTHRLAEVFELADSVTVLWGGRVALSAPVSEVTEHDLVEAIVTGSHGTPPSAAGRRSAQPAASQEAKSPVVLDVDGLVAPQVGPLSFQLREGEILGIYGLVGSGRTELLEALAGADARVAGRVELDGKKYDPTDVIDAVRRGVALVPSDRLRKSVFATLSALDNAILPTISKMSRAGILRRRGEESKQFDSLAELLRLHPRNPHLEARRYSGGNQQKLVLSRWLEQPEARPVRALLLDEPTEGVDVGARKDLYRILREFADSGRAAIVTSSEPEELAQIADRVLVLSGGKPAALLERDEIDVHLITERAHFNELENSR